jgi:hypothetical protein
MRTRIKYAIATIFVGVGLLALAWPAEAQIVYTPTNITIGPWGKYKLDVNNEGHTDFTIAAHFISGGGQCAPDGFANVTVHAPSGNGAEGTPPAELIAGDQIGPSQSFYGGTGTLASFAENGCTGKHHSGGNWVIGEPGYLGLSFQLKGETYYGWAQLTITSVSEHYGPGFVATLTGYAYETTPGMPINAGQTE